MPRMSQAEIDAFLHTPRHAVLATSRTDGSPQVSPIWFVYVDGRIYISAGVEAAKIHNLRRDPRAALCVDAGHPDGRAVMIYGPVELLEPSHGLQQEMRWRIIRHYHRSEADARAYEAATQDRSSALIVLTPQRVISQDFN